jgi:glycosyltransferase involved in cell wall biosynthesis
MQARGYATRLVRGSESADEGTMDDLAQRMGVEPTLVESMRRDPGPGDARALAELVRIARHDRPALVHTHAAKGGTLGRVAVMLAFPRRRPAVVHTFHGHSLTGYFSSRTARLYTRIERFLARRTDVLIAVSEEVRDDLVGLGVAPPSKFTVVRLGIELEQRVAAEDGARAETRRLMGVPGDAFVVGWVGRMTGVKRTDDVLGAFRGVLDRGVDAWMCVVGDGPDRDEVEERAHELGVMRRCLFLGYQDDVAPYYAAFDALLLPSVNEGTPVSAMEALASGCPVVATRVGGVPDVIRDGVDGFLVEVGDTEGLADRLAELARDPDLRAKMGTSGRERVLDRYAVDRLVDDVDRLYRSLLESVGQ